jgi:hypothetical protein
MGSHARVRITDEPAPRRPRVRVGPSRARPLVSILDCVSDPNLFQSFFRNPQSWEVWFVILSAIFALPIETPRQLSLYHQVTGRLRPPTEVAKQVTLVLGRRGGKSRILALIAVYLAVFVDHSAYLSPGERGIVQVLAADRRQARVLLRYAKAFLRVPILAKLIAGETQESVSLTNGITIEVTTASFRSVRGRTVVAALLDELAFWQSDESANPDSEVIAAIRPSMSTIPDSMLLLSSSPYARRGALYQSHSAHFGKEDDPVLVFQAPTALVNPLIDRSIIDDAYLADPSSAASEYGAEFRTDLEAFVSLDILQSCVSPGVIERPPTGGDTRYAAFLDPAGGSGKDSFTLAIGHKDKDSDLVVVDCIREARPPFSPELITTSFAKDLKSYGISQVIGDKFAGQWVQEPFRKLGIDYQSSARPKSDLYRDALPLINGRKVDLLDHNKCVQQFLGLERRVARSGKDSIDHAPGAHDDVCNVVAGLIAHVDVKRYAYDVSMAWADSLADESDHRTVQMISRFAATNGGYRP